MACHQEVVVLLWKLIDENPKFVPYIGTRDVNAVLVPLLYYWSVRARRGAARARLSRLCASFVGRQSPARASLIHVCTFVLLVSERGFTCGGWGGATHRRVLGPIG